ncbi:MAG: hypothetical protein ACRETP_01475 [Steroidobacteraceae bacterium]
MAINPYFPGTAAVYVGLSTDTKPAAGIGAKFIETDTSKVYLYLNTGAWVQVGVLTAGTGANVAVSV